MNVSGPIALLRSFDYLLLRPICLRIPSEILSLRLARTRSRWNLRSDRGHLLKWNEKTISQVATLQTSFLSVR